ncbi:MAG TPA: hypothetical protein V6D17_07485 [Candidatus Obscuribacterales bacterium]
MTRRDLDKIVGKRISRVIVAEGAAAPKYQLFLLFDDNTYFEMYADSELKFSGSTYEGGEAEVLRCARNPIID